MTTSATTTVPTSTAPTATAPTTTTARPVAPALPSPAAQADRLVALGVHDLAGVPAARLHDAARALPGVARGAAAPLLAIRPDLVPARALAGLLERAGRPGFVVGDWSDLEAFTTVPEVTLPNSVLYLVDDVDRGDDLRNASPEEALAELTARDRSPLTLHEGISWLLQQPERLEPNHCFMCLSTRLPRPRGGFDARTPALWISGGTGHDGRERRGAPKVGWCWWRNRHTWLGFASAAGRTA